MPSYNCNKDPFADLRSAGSASWAEDARKQYEATGEYRSSDLRKIVGSVTRGVEVGPQSQKEDAQKLRCDEAE